MEESLNKGLALNIKCDKDIFEQIKTLKEKVRKMVITNEKERDLEKIESSTHYSGSIELNKIVDKLLDDYGDIRQKIGGLDERTEKLKEEVKDNKKRISNLTYTIIGALISIIIVYILSKILGW